MTQQPEPDATNDTPAGRHEPVTGSAAESSTTGPEAPADIAPSAADGPAPSLADTTGTGTIVALGCIGGTVFLIVLGLLFLLVTQIFG